MIENRMVNYANVIKETNSKMFNVRDEYKDNSVEQNRAICNNDRLKFSVGCVNITGDLNVGMMIRSACLMGAENFYIFGRKRFDKRSTVGADNYINIVQYVFDDPIYADIEINKQLEYLLKWNSIVVCEHKGVSLISQEITELYNDINNPLFLFGSESHGLPDVVTQNEDFYKVSIPERGVLRSFNVSAAMNIICWDYIKHQHTPEDGNAYL